MTTVLLFAVSLVLVVAASELFTNAIEWAGWRLGLGTGATGSLLAAFGTALPETVVPIVALIGRRPDADDVAIGAVLGAPFLLLTLGVGVTGVALLLRRSRPVLAIDRAQVRRDLGTYGAGTALLALGLVLPLAGRVVCGLGLVALYARHVVATLRGGEAGEEMPEPLHLVRWRPGPPPMAAVGVQLAAAIGGLVLGADLFVAAIDRAATTVHLSALVLAVVLIPVATELPETLNSVLWVRAHDDHLALGNVLGAAAFQACVIGVIGVVFTPWRPGPAGLLGGAITVAVAAALALVLVDGRARGGRLVLAALPWVAYVALVVALGSRLGTPPPA